MADMHMIARLYGIYVMEAARFNVGGIKQKSKPTDAVKEET
jgi:hypothetical protein